MALRITDSCIACDACLQECPTGAICEGDPIYLIDPSLCCECVGFFDEPQCVLVCPQECILPDPGHKEGLEALMKKSKKLSSSS